MDLSDLATLKNIKALQDKVQSIPKLTKRGRFHFTSEPLAKVLDTKRKFLGVCDYKPCGLWHDFNGGWARLLVRESRYADWAAERFSQIQYVYKVDVDQTRMAIVGSIKEAAAFTKRFGTELPSSGLPYNFLINWLDVSKHYDGIQVRGPFEELEEKFLWLRGWDVGGGCVWNSAGVESVQIVADFSQVNE